jgi:hypothetical protein
MSHEGRHRKHAAALDTVPAQTAATRAAVTIVFDCSPWGAGPVEALMRSKAHHKDGRGMPLQVMVGRVPSPS